MKFKQTSSLSGHQMDNKHETQTLSKHGRKIPRAIPKTNIQRPEKFITGTQNKKHFYIRRPYDWFNSLTIV